MDSGADIKLYDLQNAFEKAVKKSDKNLVQLFVNKGANLNLRDTFGETSLVRVLSGPRMEIEMARFLIDLGADINAQDGLYGETALIKVVMKNRYVCETESRDVMKMLIEKGADANIKSKYDAKFENELKDDEMGSIFLDFQESLDFWLPKQEKDEMESIFLDFKKELNLLVPKQEKSEINLADELTPLMIACQKDEKEIVRILIRASADLNIQNKYGDTALHLALKSGNCFIAKLLIASQADLNLQNNLGQTPLMLAASQGDDSIVRELINAKAKIDSKDLEGKDAISYALKQGHQDIEKILSATV
jgi:ankyrin repeat protein